MKKSNHFTLIELLVVIAIISILASLLLPALSKARQSAQKTLCVSNWKQVGMGMLSFLDDNNNIMPFTNNAFKIPEENNAWGDYRYNIRPYYAGEDEDGRILISTATNNPYNIKVEQCPSFPGTSPLGYTLRRLGFTTYATYGGLPRNTVTFFEKPTQAPLIWDNDHTVYHSWGDEYGTFSWWSRDLLNIRHEGSYNYFCLDGHVESKRGVNAGILWAIYTYGNRDW